MMPSELVLSQKHQNYSFKLTSYKSLASTQTILLNSKLAPTIVKIEKRHLMNEHYVNETLLVHIKDTDYQTSMLFCKFQEQQAVMGLNWYSVGIRYSPGILKCPILSGMRQAYSHSLSLSFDNVTWSEPIFDALEFLPNIRIRSASTSALMRDKRLFREVGFLLTQPVYDHASLSCILEVSNKTYRVNMSEPTNPSFLKC